jgi:hypothetical protein
MHTAGPEPAALAGPTAAVLRMPCSPLFLPSVGGRQHPAATAAPAAGAGRECQPGMPSPSTGAGAAAGHVASVPPGDADAVSMLWQVCGLRCITA